MGNDEQVDRDDVYRWPHINEEDLLTAATIPQFLNSRGRNAPGVFVHMDWDSTEIGREVWVITEQPLQLDLEDDEDDDDDDDEEDNEEDDKEDDEDVQYLMNL